MKKQVKTKMYILLCLLMLSLISASNLTYLSVAQSVDYSYWNLDLSFQANNGTVINSTGAVFAPFDLITLRAEITNASSTVPESTVVFSIKGPKSVTHPTEIVQSEVTDSSNSTSIDFRIPIEGTEKVTGEWQVYVNAKVADTVLTQNATFQVSWPTQNISISFVDAQGQNQSNFNAGDNVTALISYESKQQQAQNISLNIKDSAGKSITQQTKQVTANATSNNKVAIEFTIPTTASNGTALSEVNVYAGQYQNRSIPVSENKTASFKIGNDTVNTVTPSATASPPGGINKNGLNWLPYLAAITGIITFMLLVMFLKRRKEDKNYSGESNISDALTSIDGEDDVRPFVSPSPASITTCEPPIKVEAAPTSTMQPSVEDIIVALMHMQTVLNQGSQPDKPAQDAAELVIQLNSIASTAKKIQELQTTLKTEQQNLNNNINDLNRTIEKQEKIIKNYYDTIRNEVKKAQKTIDIENKQTEDTN